MLSGCLSAPEIYPPEKVPPYVRQIKYFKVYATSPKGNTGITLSRGELVTIMSTGRVLRSRGSIGDLPSSWNYLYFIDDQSYGNMLHTLHGGTIEAPASGPLSLGILDSNYNDNQGHFDVTIIVPFGDWEKNPRLQAKTSVSLRYGTLSSIEPYHLRFEISLGLDHQIPQAGFDRRGRQPDAGVGERGL